MADKSYSDVFARIEKKYLLNANQFRQILQAVEQHLDLDAYAHTRVTSVYYDTPQDLLIQRSLDKPLYKEKLRVRKYETLDVGEDTGNECATDAADVKHAGEGASRVEAGVAMAAASDAAEPAGEGTSRVEACVAMAVASDVAEPAGEGAKQQSAGKQSAGKQSVGKQSSSKQSTDQVFVEIKKKYKGVVYKRRVGISNAAATAYLRGMSYTRACKNFPLNNKRAQEQSLSAQEVQVAHEIDAFREMYEDLEPAMVIACDRFAFKDKTSELRITFDQNILAKEADRAHLDFSIGEDGTHLLAQGQALMEIKQSGSLPFWLVQALDNAKAYPQSYSKYGTAYMLKRRNSCA